MCVFFKFIYTGALDSFFACAEVKLSRDSLLRMKVKHLKALLVDKGLSCRDCLEKNDFVSFLTAKLNLVASGHGTEL